MRNGVLASLRTSREHGQSNFVNPGLRLAGIGADLDVTPRLRLIGNLNYLTFDDMAVLAALRNQTFRSKSIGTDISFGLHYRPALTQNVVFNASVAALLPGQGLKDLLRRGRGWRALFGAAQHAAHLLIMLTRRLLILTFLLSAPAAHAAAPVAPKTQNAAQASAQSFGCVTCHSATDQHTMHRNPAVVLGCVDCHGGNPLIAKPAGSAYQGSGAPAYRAALDRAHVQPRFPQEWKYPSSATPPAAYTLLNRESLSSCASSIRAITALRAKRAARAICRSFRRPSAV